MSELGWVLTHPADLNLAAVLLSAMVLVLMFGAGGCTPCSQGS